MAGGHFVENKAEGEKVGALVEIFAAYLFGRHVGDRSQGGARGGEHFLCAHGGGADAFGDEGWSELGQSEVENFSLSALGDEKVGGLDIAVDDASCVCSIECVGDLKAKFEHLFGR